MNFSFRGFFVQARAIENNQIVGTFVPKNYNVITCGNSLSTATHQNPSVKQNQVLLWKAPKDFNGFVRF